MRLRKLREYYHERMINIMANNETHLVFGICPVCGRETTREVDDKTYTRYNELLNADDVDIVDYLDAFKGDAKLSAFLYGGFCENHANI